MPVIDTPRKFLLAARFIFERSQDSDIHDGRLRRRLIRVAEDIACDPALRVRMARVVRRVFAMLDEHTDMPERDLRGMIDRDYDDGLAEEPE